MLVMRRLLVFLVLCCSAQLFAQSWVERLPSRNIDITVYWFPNEPFGFQGADGSIIGIEADLLRGFQDFLRQQHHVELHYQWVRRNTFREVLNDVKNDTTGRVFGIAGFSFSDERRTFMKFSPSYMADMAVLVSTSDIPIIHTKEELEKYINGATALTAQGTILEKELIAIREKNNLNFKIEYTGGSDELVEVLRKRTRSFGFLNLPIYLMELDKGLTNLNRQNFLTKRYEWRGVGLSMASNWDEPMKEYFESPDFKSSLEHIIGSYINLDLYHFVETLRPENEVGLLNQEKALQTVQLQLQELTIREKNTKQTYLTIIIIVVTGFLVVIIIQYRRQRESNTLLKEQKAEIEAQADQIRTINDNLESLIRERTKDLENKNKALEEYAFITAHKLRAPLASILGLISLLERVSLSKEDEVLLSHLKDSAKRLDTIVHSVMNAINAAGEDPL